MSHYHILAAGLALGLGSPVEDTPPSPATARLLGELRRIFSRDAAFVLGATYAVEATSIPELELVLGVLEARLDDIPPELRRFFDMHINEWEPQHEAGLRAVVAACVSTAEYAAFAAGFRATMDALEAWWTSLSAEAAAGRPTRSRRAGSSIHERSDDYARGTVQ